MGRPIQIDIDCAEPEALAAFWAQALEYRVADPPGGHASWRDLSAAEANEPGEAWCRAVDPDRAGPSILFHRVPEPKTSKNRLHLDVLLGVGRSEEGRRQVEAEARRLVDLGATEVQQRFEDGHCFVVMQDPEGNEFCLGA